MTETSIGFPEPPDKNEYLGTTFRNATSNGASYTLTTNTDDVQFVGGGERTSTGTAHSIYYPGHTWDTWTWPPRDPYRNARCKTCGGFCPEVKSCPRVKSIDYFKDGTIKKIEFHKVEDL